MNLNFRLAIAAFLITGFSVRAQNSVSIGTTSTNASAVLWLNSAGGNQGLIIPVGNRASVATPAKGMLIFDNSASPNQLYVHDGTNWNTVGASGSGSSYSLSYNATTKVITLNPTAGSATIDISTTTLSGGDLSGTLGAPTVTKLQNKALPALPASLQYLAYDGTTGTWKFQSPAGSGDMLKATYDPTGKNADAFDLTKHTGVLPVANGGTGIATALSATQILTGNGTINSATALSGDASINSGSLKVTGLQSKVLPSLPASLQYLAYDGTTSTWKFQSPAGSGDMLKATYDPTGKNADAFDLTKHTGILPVANGGTGIATVPAINQLLATNGTGTVTWINQSAITPSFPSQTANTFYAAPNGAAGVPVFRSIVAADIPAIDASKITTGTLALARGGTGVTTAPTNGQLLIGNAGAYAVATLTAGTNISVVNGGGSVTINSTALANPMTSAGDIIFGGVAGTTTRLPGGATGVLKSNGTTPSWGTIVDADINAAAGIADTKLATINTAGKVSGGAITSGIIGGSTSINTTGDLVTTGNLSIGGTTTFGGIKYVWPTAALTSPTKYLSTDNAGNLNWATVPSPFTTLNTIPKGNGTTLVASQLYDDGTNVGIGTNTPQQLLHLKIATAGAGTSQIRLQDNINFWDIAAGNDLQFRNSAGSGLLTLWSTGASSFTGNVGIGTGSPTYPLDVVGDMRISGYYNFSGTSAANGSTQQLFGVSGSYIGVNDHFIPNNSDTQDLGTSSFQWRNLNIAGLGTFSGTGLEFTGATPSIQFPAGSTSPMIYMFKSGTGNPNKMILSHSPVFPTYGLQYDDTNDAFNFVGAGSSKMYIDLGGTVGINTTAPTSTFSVVGTADKTGGGTWGTFSDKRVKKDISSFDDGLSLLKKINPVKFKYNGLAGYKDDGKEYVGIIAQDLQPVAPYMITTVKKKLHESDSNKTDLLMYDGSALTYILVNAVKEQQKLIDEQKKQIEELKAQQNQKETTSQSELNQLKAEIATIKKALGMEASTKKK